MMGVPQIGWLRMGNSMKVDDLGCPNFKTPPPVVLVYQTLIQAHVSHAISPPSHPWVRCSPQQLADFVHQLASWPASLSAPSAQVAVRPGDGDFTIQLFSPSSLK